MPHFARYVGIDYSGAETPRSSLPGLRLYSATPADEPTEVLPPPSPRKNWTRRGIAEWLATELSAGPATLIGIDHGFSFPLRYFEVHGVPPDWSAFLDDFQRHWPTDGDNLYVDFIRDGLYGNGAARTGNSRWRRLCEERCRAKSVFHFDAPGNVAKSSHAGIPWLRYLRRELGSRVHFWPFDGWQPARGKTVIAEAYPSLWNRVFQPEGRNPHQHDAYTVARWMREADALDMLDTYFVPNLPPPQRAVAQVEGWILGLT